MKIKMNLQFFAAGRVCTGFSKPWVAQYNASGTTVTYSSAQRLARGVSVNLQPESSEDNNFYADNQVAESGAGEFTGGTVELEVLAVGENLCVKVSNTGSDIPLDKQQRIFNKFYQADESHATQGNGIGLAIVKSIVELHKGEISVHSGNGITTFTVVLPQKQ